MSTARIHYQENEQVGTCYYIKEVAPKSFAKSSLKRAALFKCGICNSEFVSVIEYVRSGKTKSCGCLNITKIKQRIPDRTTHGESGRNSKSVEYVAWSSMKKRCKGDNPVTKKHYLEKGITVCDRWLNSFENFLEDMGRRPNERYSLERIENDKGYYKENCMWATQAEQSRNKDNNILITYKNKTQCLMDWVLETGIHRNTLERRLYTWKDLEKVFETPVKTPRVMR